MTLQDGNSSFMMLFHAVQMTYDTLPVGYHPCPWGHIRGFSPTDVLCHPYGVQMVVSRIPWIDTHVRGLTPTAVLCHPYGVLTFITNLPWVTQRQRRMLHPRLYYITPMGFVYRFAVMPWVITHGCVLSPPTGLFSASDHLSLIFSLNSSELPRSSGAYMPLICVGKALNLPGISARRR